MRSAIALLVVFTATGCAREKTGAVVGPPLTIAPASATEAGPVPEPIASSAASSVTPPEPLASPVTAKFVELKQTAIEGAGVPFAFRACEQLMIAVVRGTARALGQNLRAGDVLVARGAGELDVRGEGLLVMATVQPPHCEPVAPGTPIMKAVVRATAPELVWAGGQMRAHLDVGADVSPNAYVGRLEGSAPVAEHTHADAWEILFAVEAAGTFTLDGKDQRLGPRQIVSVPPGVKHAWKPDPGSKLVAVQIYAPPGPEQRFRALALAAADAGAAKDAGKRP